MNKNKIVKLISLGVSLLFTFITVVSSCSTVSAGHVGVITDFGKVRSGILNEGIHFIQPLAIVHKVSTQHRAVNMGNVASASRDLQKTVTNVSVAYYINGAGAPCVHQRFGGSNGLEINIFYPGIQESVKAATSQYTAEELITKRPKVKFGIEEGIKLFVETNLKSKGCSGAITIPSVAVTDFDFSNEFNQAIEAKVKAEQDSLKAKNEKEKRITQAEAEAAERKLVAESIAYKTEVESKARAEAIARESKALMSSPELVNLRIAERWDGKLPHYTGGNIPLLNIK